jgi:hypothetical protein
MIDGIQLVNELNLLAASNPQLGEMMGVLLSHTLKVDADESLINHPKFMLIQESDGIYYGFLSFLNGISDKVIAMRHNDDGTFGGFMIVPEKGE